MTDLEIRSGSAAHEAALAAAEVTFGDAKRKFSLSQRAGTIGRIARKERPALVDR